MPIVNSLAEHRLGKKNCTILERISAGDFPLESLSADMQSLAVYYREFFGVPPAATAMVALTLLSAAVGPLAQVANGSERGATPLNIWSVIIATRGSGKSWLVKNLGKELFDADRQAYLDFQEAQNAIEERLKLLRLELGDKQGWRASELALEARRRIKNLEGIRNLRLVIGTASGEALKKVVAEAPDRFTATVCTEGYELLSIMMGKYAGEQKQPQMDVWLAMKTGDFLNDIRLCRETVTVRNGLMSMLLMIQPTVASQVLTRDMMDRGFFSRMFIFDPGFKPQKANRQEIPICPREFFDTQLRHYLRLRRQLTDPDLTGDQGPKEILRRVQEGVRAIPCDTQAQEVFKDFHDEGIEIQELLAPLIPEIIGENSRWREDAIQIAGLLACLENRLGIDRDLSERACAIVRWCKKSFLLLAIRDCEAPKSKFERLLELLEDSDNGCLSARDLQKTHGFLRKDLDLMLEFNPSLICREIKKPPKQGRPSVVVRLINPSE
jgi:hypothetical protein